MPQFFFTKYRGGQVDDCDWVVGVYTRGTHYYWRKCGQSEFDMSFEKKNWDNFLGSLAFSINNKNRTLRSQLQA